MPTVAAARELLAPRRDVWAFLAEPHNLAAWWPGIVAVHADRRGLAPGARWQVSGAGKPSLIRKPEASGTLLVVAVEPQRRFAFQLTGDRINAELELEDASTDRTSVKLAVSGPWLIGLRGSFPVRALNRLHALCQTGARP